MRKKVLFIALIVSFGVLQYRLWIGDASVVKLVRLAKTIKTEETSVGKLNTRNQKLDLEVQALKGSAEALEEQARTELGMIKQGETFYLVAEPAQ